MVKTKLEPRAIASKFENEGGKPFYDVEVFQSSTFGSNADCLNMCYAWDGS
jgi:hypothetical protein